MARIFESKTDAEEAVKNLLDIVAASGKYHQKSDAELREIIVRYRSSVCYRIREILSSEHPLWYDSIRYELRQRAFQKQKIKN